MWMARLDIPVKLRPAFGGKRVLTKSLNTANKTEAKQLAAVIVARWRQQFRTAAGQDPLVVEAQGWRDWLDETSTGDPEDDTSSLILTDRAQQIEDLYGEEAAQLFVRVADGRALMLDALADRWLAWRQYPPRSEYQHRRHLHLLLQHHRETASITRKAASKFTADVLTPGRDGQTINKILSTYRQLWRWMLREEILRGTNPWSEQGPPKSAKVKGRRSVNGGSERRPFTEEEAKAFLVGLEGVDRDVVMLMAVTALRLEEACAVQTGKVVAHDGITWIEIAEGKSKAARRRVPIVDPQVQQMLAHRAAEARRKGHKALFQELPEDRFKDRSKALSKRLGRHLRAIGLVDPALVGGHSLRHRGRTLMEHAGILPGVADWFMGQKRPGVGMDRYSKPSDAQLIDAERAIPLPR
jgi:integrase